MKVRVIPFLILNMHSLRILLQLSGTCLNIAHRKAVSEGEVLSANRGTILELVAMFKV